MIGLAGCATRPPASDPEALAEFEANNDPLEPLNRGMYEVNNAIDAAVLRPAAVAYRAVIPPPLREGVRNALGNLRAPTILMNDLLQGEMDRAGRTASRFLINSTLGLGGLVDVAEWQFGIRGHGEDFGQTLAVWGVPSGGYFVVPIFGPSTLRDAAAMPLDRSFRQQFSPSGESQRWRWVGVQAVHGRAEVLPFTRMLDTVALDKYVYVRDAYLARRRNDVFDGNPPPMPDEDDSPATPAPSKSR